jgi:predicted peptidase
MRRAIRSAVTVLAILARPGSAQRIETGFLDRLATVGAYSYHYQVYIPASYAAVTSWPVILFLHGNGERGSDGLLQTARGLPSTIRLDPSRFPAIVVMPQVPSDSFWEGAPTQAAMTALRQTLTEFHADSDRVYLTGASMGGRGVWYLAYRYPRAFAAIAPICGWVTAPSPQFQAVPPLVPPDSGPPLAALARQLRHLPIWIFHGEMDTNIPVAGSRDPAAAFKALGSNARYTEYLGMGHNVWDATYGSKEFVDWLFAQRRARR